MTQSTVFTCAVATTLLQQLQNLLAQATLPCQQLGQQLATCIAQFLAAPITPTTTHDFEHDLRQLLDECGRQTVESVFNLIEPEQPQDAPKHLEREQLDYVRKNHKSPTRGGLSTLFGTITLQRCLYEPLQEARDDGQRSFAPLELCLGVVAGNATPALAERVGHLASQHTQQELLDLLQRDHHVSWSVQVLRQVTAAVSAGIAPYLRARQEQAVLDWLAKTQRRRGRRRVVLAVGRDGLMLPIRQAAHYKEGSVATVTVYDRRGRRLGTVYLGEMPESGQLTLSAELTALLEKVLSAWAGPLPRLLYLTDAGAHPTAYFTEVLQPMEHPRRPGQRLGWQWIIDYYHAAGYVTQLATALFSDEARRRAWSRRMRRVLRDQAGGVERVLQSAAQHHGRAQLSAGAEQDYREAYQYLRRHRGEMQYSSYRRQGLPIGSGVTEAGCKVVFSQRFKESGMTWSVVGGAVILRLRLAVLSGVWEEVYRDYLQNQPLVRLATRLTPTPAAKAKIA